MTVLDMNSAQQRAVRYLDGPCLVLAGAGSGKTRVITHKMAWLIQECGYDPRHVLALTFTNKAAHEMGERVRKLVDARSARGLSVSTFHSLGVKLLREEARLLGLKPEFSILDSSDTYGILQELLSTTDKSLLRSVQHTLSNWKNGLVSPHEAVQRASNELELQAARVFASYEATLRAYQAVDFDDLIGLPVRLLSEQAEARERWQSRVRYLLVDEYQDTNACQYEWVKLMVGPRAMLTAVGDDDQAIYAWRGATLQNMARLSEDYPRLEVIKLEQNYRSVQRILEAANQVIQNNPKLYEKTLWSELGIGEPIQVIPFDGEDQEAESVAMRISASRFERRARWKDFAILYRSNHQARPLEQALRALKIPYTVSGGQSFFDRAEIRDIVAYLRLIANDSDDPAFVRAATTPRRGIGQATLETLGHYAAERGISLYAAVFEEGLRLRLQPRQLEPLREFAEFIGRMQWRALRGREGSEGAASPEPAGEILDDLVRAIQYEQWLYENHDERAAQTRWQGVLELCQWLKTKAEEDGLGLVQWVQHLALISLLEKNEGEEPDAVKLSTLHAAKGLEYPHVYLVGVEEGLLPHLGREDDAGSAEAAAEALALRIQEERRLMYVGITRAQRSLTLTWCRKRRRAREDVERERSRFVSEMGLDTAPTADTDPGLSPKQRLANLKALLER